MRFHGASPGKNLFLSPLEWDANQNVKWFRTIVVMDRVKVGLEVPVS
jgi:hypothetical protein